MANGRPATGVVRKATRPAPSTSTSTTVAAPNRGLRPTGGVATLPAAALARSNRKPAAAAASASASVTSAAAGQRPDAATKTTPASRANKRERPAPPARADGRCLPVLCIYSDRNELIRKERFRQPGDGACHPPARPRAGAALGVGVGVGNSAGVATPVTRLPQLARTKPAPTGAAAAAARPKPSGGVGAGVGGRREPTSRVELPMATQRLKFPRSGVGVAKTGVGVVARPAAAAAAAAPASSGSFHFRLRLRRRVTASWLGPSAGGRKLPAPHWSRKVHGDQSGTVSSSATPQRSHHKRHEILVVCKKKRNNKKERSRRKAMANPIVGNPKAGHACRFSRLSLDGCRAGPLGLLDEGHLDRLPDECNCLAAAANQKSP